MNKLILVFGCLLFCLILVANSAKATHIVGGVMNYECLDATTQTYRITLKVYKDCSPGVTTVLDAEAPLHFLLSDMTEYIWKNAPLISTTDVPINITDPCVTVPPVCVQEGIYITEVILNVVPAGGLLVVYQRCCRNASILNVLTPTDLGSSFFCTITDTTLALCNSNPVYNLFPPLVICVNTPIEFDHSATDTDGDSLVYSLCTPSDGAYLTGPTIAGGAFIDPIIDIPWLAPYSELDMLGGLPALSIHPTTGALSGVPPTIGKFVVGVCVTEYRDGVMLSSTKRDFQYNVTTCIASVIAATPLIYANCEDLLISFTNNSTGAIPIVNAYWDFGVTGSSFDTSTIFNPNFIYPDTGTYNVMLVANPGLSCADTTFSEVRIYPILVPGFLSDTACAGQATAFNDTSLSTFGFVNYWNWAFGDGGTSTAGGSVSHVYTTAGTYNSTFIVGNSTGCLDTLTRSIIVSATPVLTLSADTTMCANDFITINGSVTSSASMSYQWGPMYNILGETTASPSISPDVSTTYLCTVTNANGCIDTASVRITVADSTFATALISDNTLCIGDTLQLSGSGGFVYSWAPNTNIIGATSSNALAFPTASTIYTLTVSIGSCIGTDTVSVQAKPKPQANAIDDLSICLGDSAQLDCTGATYYSWNIDSTLSQTTIANPVAYPTISQNYYVSTTIDNGCNAVAYDTVRVNVLYNNTSFAGPDAYMFAGGTYPLYAASANSYSWSPGLVLSDSTIQNPICNATVTTNFVLTTTDAAGCQDYDTIQMRVYDPGFAMPTAFSPDGDGFNDLLIPYYKGIETLYEFKIFNRWGELIFYTKDIAQGWNGYFNDKPQPMSTYVYYVKAKTFEKEDVELTGNVTLVR
jgi:gliding motility-associated-like protein